MSSKQPTHKRSGLGGSPLSQGLFSKTDAKTDAPVVKNVAPTTNRGEQESQPKATNIESRKKNLENRFLEDVEDGSKESIGLQVTTEINDWLDQIVKVGRR